MTRTERSLSPRALLKDRSESKSGMDKSLRKQGAGTHNWGSLADERELERAAVEDAHEDRDDIASKNEATSVTDGQTRHGQQDAASAVPIARPTGTGMERRSSGGSMSEEEVESAREYRRGALKNGNVDLGSIARTSAGAQSSSPPTKAQAFPKENANISV